MDALIGEVSCTEVLGIAPSEQALTGSFVILAVWRVRTASLGGCASPRAPRSSASAVLLQLPKLTAPSRAGLLSLHATGDN